MVQGKIVAPHLATCHRRVIDFFVVSCNMAEMVVGAVAVRGRSLQTSQTGSLVPQSRCQDYDSQVVEERGEDWSGPSPWAGSEIPT